MEITKKEIIASITIITIMLLLGILISGKISEYQMDQNEKYNKALKIETEELFRYGMETNVGNSFIYGDLEAIDTVTYPELDEDYLSVKKVKERYTQHTRTVTKTVNGKTVTETKTYWTWDVVHREEIQSKKVKFCGADFNSSKFNVSSYYLTTIKESSKIRYKYYIYPAITTGTIFAYLSDGEINDKSVNFYRDRTIKETVDYLQSGVGQILFWIFWILLIAACVYGFYYLDNRWLD